MSNIVMCEYCNGTGIAKCETCGGNGKVTCPECDGSGKSYFICPECDNGRVPDPRAMDDDETMTCPTCHGEYKKEVGACKTCKGTGKVECQPCHGSGKVECQACNATGKFDVEKIVKAAIVADWYDVETDKKVKKRTLSDEDVSMFTAFKNDTLTLGAEHKGYISVFSLTDESRGVTIKNLKYTLDNATLYSYMPVGVSNEFLGLESSIAVEDGVLLVVYKNYEL